MPEHNDFYDNLCRVCFGSFQSQDPRADLCSQHKPAIQVTTLYEVNLVRQENGQPDLTKEDLVRLEVITELLRAHITERANAVVST